LKDGEKVPQGRFAERIAMSSPSHPSGPVAAFPQGRHPRLAALHVIIGAGGIGMMHPKARPVQPPSHVAEPALRAPCCD